LEVYRLSNGSTEKVGKINFLKVRLEIAQKEWEKANKKWMNSKHCIEAIDANIAVKNSMTKMAFFNGQRKVLKELIKLEEKS
jgi:hypothetical protein